MAKDRKTRIPDIAIVRYEIEEALSGPHAGTSEKQKTPVAAPSIFRRALPVVTVALLAGIVAGLAVWVALRPGAQAIVRLTVASLSPEQVSRLSPDWGPAITPDGRRIVYSIPSENSDEQTLYVRALDELGATPINGLGSARAPFVSPDGRWVGFFYPGTMKKVAIDGGPGVTIYTTQALSLGASWGQDDAIVFATTDTTTGLMRVSAAGGTPEVLTKPNAANKELDHIFPEMLPGGRAVLFTITSTEMAARSKTHRSRCSISRPASRKFWWLAAPPRTICLLDIWSTA